MEKKELANILSDVLIPTGFKKKGNYWVINGDEITKMVNLQKSQFSNRFYINYGYILNALPLGNFMMHVNNRVSSLDVEERDRITKNGLFLMERWVSSTMENLAEIETFVSIVQ